MSRLQFYLNSLLLLLLGQASLLLGLALERGSPRGKSVSSDHGLTNEFQGGEIPSSAVPISDLKLEDLPLLVPDTGKINNSLLKEIGADKFLSLWFMFVLSEKVVVSAEPWTLLVPLNSGLPNDGVFLVDRELTKEVLLNHVSLGDTILLHEAVAESPQNPFYSLANSELIFTREGANTFVNGIRIIGEKLTIGNAVIYVIEKSLPVVPSDYYDYLSNIDLENLPLNIPGVDTPLLTVETTTTTVAPTTPKKAENVEAPAGTRFDKFRSTGSGNFNALPKRKGPSLLDLLASISPKGPKKAPENKGKSITAEPISSLFDEFTENTEAPSKAKVEATISNVELVDDPKVNFEFMNEAPNSNLKLMDEFFMDPKKPDTFLNSLIAEIDREQSIGAEFLNHFRESNMSESLTKDASYTLFLPTNSAFYDYYPIDWGFNPFDVDNFTVDVLTNHFIPGNIHIQDIPAGGELTTMGGKAITVTVDQGRPTVNGIPIMPEMEVEFPKGRIYYINQLLFVDFDRVFTLRDEYPYLESASLLSFPWPGSPFLSHLLQKLENDPERSFFTQMLRDSSISQMVSSSDEDLNRLSYTVFIPSDASLKETFATSNPSAIAADRLNTFLLQHIVSEYLFEDDMQDGLNVISLSGKILPITNNKDGIFIGEAKIIAPQQFLFNLGSVFLVDRPLKEFTFKSKLNPVEALFATSPSTTAAPTTTARPATEPIRKSETPSLPLASELLQELPQNAELQEETTATPEVSVSFETRTEISFSKQVNDGEIIPVSRQFVEKINNRLRV